MLAALHLAHLGCVHMKTLAKTVSCGLELTLILKDWKGHCLLLGLIQQRHLPWEAQSGMHFGIEERAQKLNFSIVVEFFSKCVFSPFPNFCHGN